MKKTVVTILFALVITLSFAQKKPVKDSIPSDSLTTETPLFSIADMEKLNVVIMKQFDLTEQGKYQIILKEIQTLIAEGQKKRKQTPETTTKK